MAEENLFKPTAGILTSEDMARSPETAKSCCVSQQRAFSHPKTWQESGDGQDCCVSQQQAFSHPKTWQGVRRRPNGQKEKAHRISARSK
jgi:uncharacterized Zn-finger protein